ncbi:MAG: helix-turn-helix transcriptional regulator [Betaproteobacteria bacterium]|nr:helix-turn-helix transcriptional regulator [Betaproteobacteria bacterium]
MEHNRCVKQHIYVRLVSERRRLQLSQEELAARAGLRREKLNRVESKHEDISLEEICRLLDAVGLALVVQKKEDAIVSSAPPAPDLIPKAFDEAAFIDGPKAKILNWGKVPE